MERRGGRMERITGIREKQWRNLKMQIEFYDEETDEAEWAANEHIFAPAPPPPAPPAAPAAPGTAADDAAPPPPPPPPAQPAAPAAAAPAGPPAPGSSQD